MKKFLPVLKRSPLFKGISETETEAVTGCLCSGVREYKKGEYILSSGMTTDSIGLLLSGSALILQEDFWGNRNILARVNPGQLFAESFACSPGAVLNVSVEAEAVVQAAWLSVNRILTPCACACSFHSKVTRNLLFALAQKNLHFNEKLTHMGQRSTRGKLLSFLSAEAQRSGAAEFDIPFDRQQLADYLSVERSAMSRELSRLKEEGLLDFHKNRFWLHEY